MAQVTKAIIIYCLMIFPSTKSKNDLIFGLTTSKQLEATLFQKFICSHTSELISNKLLQQQQNHGSSMKNTYHLLFEDLALNQKQNNLIIGSTTSKYNWIHHIKNTWKPFSFINSYAMTY